MTAAEFAAVMDAAYVDMRPWSAADIDGLLASPHTVFIHTDYGGLLGRIIADEAEILAFATTQPGQGHGSTLLSRFEAEARAKGVTTVFLDVAAGNTTAHRFYLTKGFAQTGRRRAYYTLRDGQRDDALLMSKALS